MPTLLDYPTTLQTLQQQGLKSLYHNSGAFGFSNPANLSHAGWIGPPDPTLRPSMLPLATPISPPYPSTLASLALRAWQTLLPGPAWLMPLAHWSYELDFGSRDWLPNSLRAIGIDPLPLHSCNTGNALEFSPNEPTQFTTLLTSLLERLTLSDFMLAFPPHPTLCTIHHHQQLWWTTNDSALLNHLKQLPHP